jgi:hypothetical protein
VAWGVSILLNALGPAEGNPLGVPALGRRAGQLVALVVNAAALVGLVIAAAAPFLRFRHAGYQQRQQLKWVALTVAVSFLCVLVSLGLGQLFPGVPVIVLLGLLGLVGVLIGLPLAVAVAILRHRLYDIDRVINRTLVYGLLTVLLGAVYTGGVFGLGQLLNPVTGESALAVAASTLAVAALFQPARPASKRSWIAASTGGATTRPRPSGRSAPGCAIRSTSIPSRLNCWLWWTRPWSRRGCRCGCGPGEPLGPLGH